MLRHILARQIPSGLHGVARLVGVGNFVLKTSALTNHTLTGSETRFEVALQF
jgi:hypothetical protein